MLCKKVQSLKLNKKLMKNDFDDDYVIVYLLLT